MVVEARIISGELVAFPVSGKGYAAPPLPVPHATAVFDIVPFEENVAHPAVPPAEDTIRFVVDAFVEKRLPAVSAVEDAYANVRTFAFEIANAFSVPSAVELEMSKLLSAAE